MHYIFSDGFSVFMLCFLAVCVFFLGISVGLAQAPTDCDSFGKFKHAGVVYECKKGHHNG